jgi:DivIVA domain-containing protein
MTMNDADPRDPVLNGDEVRNVTFGAGTYDKPQVDDLLDRIAAELDAGRPAGPLIANAMIRNGLFYRGYDTDQVDWFLEQLRRRADPAEAARMNADPWRDLAADPYCIRRGPGRAPAWRITAPSKQEYAGAWRDFGHQPGTRLSWVRTGAGRRELRAADQRAVASGRFGLLDQPKTLTAGGRTFTWKRVTQSSWPGIADTISRDRPGIPKHILYSEAGKKDSDLRQLRDETGTPILYARGGHPERFAYGYIKFPGQRWLRFPVRGTNWADTIMTAVDQEGNKVARYRLIRYRRSVLRTAEITVHPDQRLTDELALVIAASAPWLYFESASSGPV